MTPGLCRSLALIAQRFRWSCFRSVHRFSIRAISRLPDVFNPAFGISTPLMSPRTSCLRSALLKPAVLPNSSSPHPRVVSAGAILSLKLVYGLLRLSHIQLTLRLDRRRPNYYSLFHLSAKLWMDTLREERPR